MKEKEKLKLVENFKSREYQQNLFINSLDKNTFVVLPTGLGKTIIALMLFVYYFNKHKKKILFLAPTKPLVIQQKKSFESFILNKEKFNFCELLGTISPKKREVLYKENDFFFSTPQLIENDILNKKINMEEFCFCVYDEAHRASGNYAYCFLAKQFMNFDIKTLGLSASPGDNYDSILEVLSNLNINNILIKKNTDLDVKPYVKKTKVDKIEVKLEKDILELFEFGKKTYEDLLEKLIKTGFVDEKKTKYGKLTKTDLLGLQSFLRDQLSLNRDNPKIWDAIILTSAIMKFDYGMELLSVVDVGSAYEYFLGFYSKDKSKAVELIKINIHFKQLMKDFENSKKIIHPKIIKVKEILKNEFLENTNKKIIIFSSYRNCATKLNEEISKIKNVKSSIFVGQSKKGNIAFSQKKQKQTIEDFKENKINVIVSTSVGEEGLDIPQVDLVIFYEPIPSAIRSIQRIGRTGRQKEGRAIILITKDTKEINIRFISNAKEKRMYVALNKIKNEFENQIKKPKSLLNFTQTKKEKKIEKVFELEIEDKDFKGVVKSLKLKLD